ncbi:NADPH:quinone reductase [Castellaniella sp.]|uniref:NADPH:quinone reductase n=1 Tax=Castellaniella sp. TaxID=1955812 RepID=UPI00355EC754
MHAAWYEKNGPAAEVLQVGLQPDPQAGAGEVRVRLRASGVNPSDTKSRAGGRPVRWDRIIPHSDGAGEIDQVGEGVAPGRLGERVWVWNGQWQRPSGTAAQYIALPAVQAVTLPPSVSFEEGACLGIPAMTAFHAVRLLGDVHGKTILVTGGASGVGFYAAQMARLWGAHVITTVGSAEKAAAMAAAGLPDVILYKQGDVAHEVLQRTDQKGVDGLVDLDFSSSHELVSQGAVAPHACVVPYGSNRREPVALDFWAWLYRSISLRPFLVYELRPGEREAAINGINQMLRAGKLRHLVGEVCPLSDIVRAHEAVESGRVLGNVVVDCA